MNGELVEVDAIAVRWHDDGSAIVAAIVSDGRACGSYVYAVEYLDAVGRDVSRMFRESLRNGRRIDPVNIDDLDLLLAELSAAEPWTRYLAHDGATDRPLFVGAVRS
jgi:hypothetical protein